MKRFTLIAFILITIQIVFGINFPRLTGRVVDDANVFSTREESNLTQFLAGMDKESNIQAVIVSVKSLEGYSVADYTVRLAEKWKIGNKGSDRGLILLVAPNDRKVRIEVGYGLESVITDGIAGYIIRQEIIPGFKSGNYYIGVSQGIKKIYQVATGKTKVSKEDIRRSKKSGGSRIFTIIVLILIFSLFRGRLFPFIILSQILGGGGGNHRDGGGFGGGFSGGGGGFGGGGASGSW